MNRKKQSFFRSLNSRDRYMIGNLFFLYFIEGIYVLLIGSILPMMKTEYQLDYQVGGWMISAHSVGNLVAGLCAGFLPLAVGLKRSLLWLNVLPFLGFAITLVTGNPALLVFALLLTGLGRGAVCNYDNQVVSTLSRGSPAPLNALHGFFAIGAVTAPLLALLCIRGGDGGWRYAVYVIIALGLTSIVTSAFMDMSSITGQHNAANGRALGFLRERPYQSSVLITFFYLCIEASIMGWMVSYYTDCGVAKEDSAQLLTSLLWITILIGRFVCSALGGRMGTKTMIRVLTAGMLLFLVVLLASSSLIPMLVGTIGLGLSMSGMYGTAVSNAGDVFGRYPMAMSLFMALTSLGSVFTPSLIGGIAEMTTLRTGMAVLLVPAAILFVLALLNKGPDTFVE